MSKFVPNSYKKLTIDQKINLRSWRNALNINWLFSTVLNDCNIQSPAPERIERPLRQIGLYHPYGKYHSLYKKDWNRDRAQGQGYIRKYQRKQRLTDEA